jgi:hypothetical protein
MTGPFETEQQVWLLPAVQAVYAAFDRDPGAGKMAPHNLAMLTDALSAAGVELGAYDERIAAWLARWEPQTAAVIAGWVGRARAPEPGSGTLAAAGLDGAAAGLEELAGLINFRVGAWQDFGYAEPPTPDCATIPPLGERSAKAIEAGHEAIKDIDQLIARLHQVRAQLVSELRQDEDIRATRVDAMLAASARDDAR